MILTLAFVLEIEYTLNKTVWKKSPFLTSDTKHPNNTEVVNSKNYVPSNRLLIGLIFTEFPVASPYLVHT